MNVKLVKILDGLIEAGILFVVFFAPLYFSFFYQYYPLYSLDKAAFFQILVEAITIFVLIKVVLTKKFSIIGKKKYLFPAFLFFFALVLTTIFSINPSQSFWGSYMRRQGLFAYSHYFLFLFILLFHLKSGRRINRVINAILAGGFIAAAYGILQWLGLEFVFWQRSYLFGRVVSTMGQPVFLANYLLLTIFLAAYKVVAGDKFSRKFLYALILIFQFFGLIFTYTRGAWLGLAFGVFFGVFLYFYVAGKKPLKAAAVLLLAAAAISSLFLFAKIFSTDVRGNFFLDRVKNIADIKSGSSAMRLIVWSAAADAIGKSPIIGYGLENQQTVLTSYYEPLWSVYEKINTVSDRAHNIVLDLALEGGIVLLSSYIIFLSVVFISAARYLAGRSGAKNDWLLFFLIAGIAAYQFSLLFSFSVIETNIIFWTYLGIIIILLSDFKEIKTVDFGKAKKIYFIIFIYFAILSAAFAAYFIGENADNIRAEYYFRQAREDYVRGDYPEMFNNYVLALKFNNKQNYYYWWFASDSLRTFDKINSPEYRDSLMEYIQNNLKISEWRSDNYIELFVQAEFYTILGKYKDNKYFVDAKEAYGKLIKESPFMPDSYLSQGRMHYLAGEYEKSLAVYETALSVLPDLNSPGLNREHKRDINNFITGVYGNMIQSYKKLNDTDSQLAYYKKIIGINPYRLDVYGKMADIYFKKKNLNKAIWYNKRGYMLNPRDYVWPFSVALLYKERGDKDEALKYARKALELAPKNKNIQKFISNF